MKEQALIAGPKLAKQVLDGLSKYESEYLVAAIAYVASAQKIYLPLAVKHTKGLNA